MNGKKRREKILNKFQDDFGAFKFDEYRDNDSFMNKLNLQFNPKEPPENHSTESSNRIRLLIGFFFLFLLMILLVIRMGYWQIVRADDLKEMATAMQKVDTEIESVRGSIYDSKMNTLAETVTKYELYAYTQYLYKDKSLSGADKDAVLSNLIKITGKDKDELLKKLDGKENLVLLADGLSKDAVDKAQKLWDGNVVVKTKVSRYYPNGAFASQLLGGVNSENTGRTGLEYEYNSVLAGVKGRTVKTTDSQGDTLANGSARYYQAQDGYNVVTTIDSVIQHYLEDAVAAGMERTGASSITAIAMNPKTGDVLALAQTPEYDPNESSKPSDPAEYAEFKKMDEAGQSEYLSRMWTIEPISSVYEPGSTFKLFAAATALETGKANENSRYYCGGHINVDGVKLGCLDNHGSQSLKVAVGNSCNAALGQVALDMGALLYYSYIDMFGFRDQTGIDLPGETFSIVKNPNGMSNIDLATTGYGQGIAVTPIQILSAVNAFGNGGVIMKPKVAKRIVDQTGKTVEEFPDVKVRQVVSEETAAEMRNIMEYYVAEGGGGDKAYVPGYRIGGKTGTANIASGGGYSSDTDCSYVAMAPMDDPQISVLIIVHKPTKTQYGNNSAGPMVREIMEKSLMYMGVEREYTEQEAAAALKNKADVPNVTGTDSQKAVEILKSKELKYTFVPENVGGKSFVVADQYPKAGAKVDKGTTLYLYSK